MPGPECRRERRVRVFIVFIVFIAFIDVVHGEALAAPAELDPAVAEPEGCSPGFRW